MVKLVIRNILFNLKHNTKTANMIVIYSFVMVISKNPYIMDRSRLKTCTKTIIMKRNPYQTSNSKVLV